MHDIEYTPAPPLGLARGQTIPVFLEKSSRWICFFQFALCFHTDGRDPTPLHNVDLKNPIRCRQRLNSARLYLCATTVQRLHKAVVYARTVPATRVRSHR